MPGPLSRAQIESFKAEGILILPDFVEEAQLARWREQVWAGLGADPDDRSTWPTHTQHPPVADGISPTPGELPQFQALMEQLGGGFFEGGGAQHACIFPSLEASEWKKPGSGHVDGYNGRWAGVGAHRLGTTFYLDDCEERGGGFTYWRGGHARVHERFRAHPEEVDGRLVETAEYKEGKHPYLGGGEEGTVHAVKAGTVCVWHGWCPHNASQNATDTPRLAIISRWNDSRFVGPPVQMKYGETDDEFQLGWDDIDDEMRQEPRYLIKEDMFADWGPDVSGAGTARL